MLILRALFILNFISDSASSADGSTRCSLYFMQSYITCSGVLSMLHVLQSDISSSQIRVTNRTEETCSTPEFPVKVQVENNHNMTVKRKKARREQEREY